MCPICSNEMKEIAANVGVEYEGLSNLMALEELHYLSIICIWLGKK
jgi:hypothetical protein